MLLYFRWVALSCILGTLISRPTAERVVLLESLADCWGRYVHGRKKQGFFSWYVQDLPGIVISVGKVCTVHQRSCALVPAYHLAVEVLDHDNWNTRNAVCKSWASPLLTAIIDTCVSSIVAIDDFVFSLLFPTGAVWKYWRFFSNLTVWCHYDIFSEKKRRKLCNCDTVC